MLPKTEKHVFGSVKALLKCPDEHASGSACVESSVCQWDFLRTETKELCVMMILF